MTSHSRFENLRISDSDDDNAAAIVNNNNNNNNNNANNNSSINFISQSITNDKSEFVKNTAADFTSVDVCNDLFSVTNISQPLPSQETKVSAPIGSTSEHSSASLHNAQFIDNEVNNNIDGDIVNELAGNAHCNVMPLVTSKQNDVNMTINPSDTVNNDNSTNVRVVSNTVNDTNIVENNKNTKHDNEVRHRHKRVRRPRQSLDPSSKLLTEGARSKELLNSTQKSSSTVNEPLTNVNTNNNTTHTITDAEQEQSIKFEEITQSMPQSNSLNTNNIANVCDVNTQNITSGDNIIQITTSSSVLPTSSVQSSEPMISPLISQTALPLSLAMLSSHLSISPTLPRRDPVIPSPSELDPPIEHSSSFPEEEEEKLISSHGKAKTKTKTKLHDSSPHGKVVPVVNNEGKQVWMMAVSSHASKRQTHRAHIAALHDSDNDSKEYSTEEEEKRQEVDDDDENKDEEEEVIIKPLFAVRPPPRHLSKRAQNIMYAAIQAMESKIRERHAAAVKRAVQENMATTHQVYNLPNLFIYSVANNVPDSTPLAVNYITSSSSNNVKYASSSPWFPPPHMRLRRNNASLSPHEREWCTHRYDTHAECEMVYKK